MTQFWNRATQSLEEENVYGGGAIGLLYGTRLGRTLMACVASLKFPSRLMGWYYSSRLSARAVEPFIRRFEIPREEFEPGPFASFNAFFIRKFRDGARPFAQERAVLPAFAEARYLGWAAAEDSQRYPVKGARISLSELLGSAQEARPFEGGPVLIARLCPTDYHRFHYPDAGRTIRSWRLPGELHSVNPVALEAFPEVFFKNERQISILETENFGLLAYVEVGAFGVGRIVQTHPEGQPFTRGQEKGYFLFGASTVIVVGQAGKWAPAGDVLEQTGSRHEVWVRLGDGVGRSK